MNGGEDDRNVIHSICVYIYSDIKYIWSFKTTPSLHLHNTLHEHNSNLPYNKTNLLTIRKTQLRKPKLAEQNNFRVIKDQDTLACRGG